MENFKKNFYLRLAAYFAFWARLVLRRWQPDVVLVTGSSGKTTVFSLLRAQLGDKAFFAEHANSAYGIPFNILGLERQTYTNWEWVKLFVMAPFCLNRWKNRGKIYVVEADAERPGEADFLQKLLEPEYVIITNIFQTHALYFDQLVAEGKYARALDAVAAEFVKYLRGARKRALINADNQTLFETVEKMELPDEVRANMVYLQEADYLREYKIYSDRTEFVINGVSYVFPYFLPQEVAMGIEITRQVCNDLGVRMGRNFDAYVMPPGRSSVLRGVRETTLIDSTYNANLGSALAVLEAFKKYPSTGEKWLVLGEFRDQGQEAREQHLQLADYLIRQQRECNQFVLISPEMQEWVYPLLRQAFGGMRVRCFLTTKEAYAWIWANLRGGETILLKGSQGRHLEGIVEGLLADPADAEKLPRRGEVFRAKQLEVLSGVVKESENERSQGN